MATHSAEITIEASQQQIFEALTNPEWVERWQFGRVVATDWRVGSPITFSSNLQGHSEPFLEWGTILDFRPDELIQYSLFTPRGDLEDKPENYSVTSYRLSDDNGHSRVEIVQQDNRPSGFAPSTLKPILAALKNVVEVTMGSA